MFLQLVVVFLCVGHLILIFIRNKEFRLRSFLFHWSFSAVFALLTFLPGTSRFIIAIKAGAIIMFAISFNVPLLAALIRTLGKDHS